MMTDTCGPMSPTPFAYYDPDTSSVRTSQATFPWDSTPSSPTLPHWGSMRGGELFERPTPAPLTVARGCSSLLPTPLAQMNGPSQRELDAGNPRNRLETEVHLLQTPVADHSRGLPQPGTDYQSLPNVAVSLLPMPTLNNENQQNLDRYGPNLGMALMPELFDWTKDNE